MWTNNLYSQGTKLPTNTYSTRSEELSSSQKIALKDHYEQHYPRAIYFDEATTTYNCHAYAWHTTEGGHKVWINSDASGCPSTYWTDGSYILTTKDDPLAKKVSYPNGDHSAITSNPTHYVISKWGSGCLMKHTYNDCPYNSTNLRYYKSSMVISGEKTIMIPNSSTSIIAEYSLSNTPAGASVEWDITPSSTSFTGQGTNRIQVTLTNNIFISAVVKNIQGCTTIIPTFQVQAAKAPIITDIEIFQYGQTDGDFTLRAITNQPDATYTWSANQGTIHDIPYPGDATFADHPNIYKAISFPSNGYYTISVYGRMGNYNGEIFSKEFHITTATGGLLISSQKITTNSPIAQ